MLPKIVSKVRSFVSIGVRSQMDATVLAACLDCSNKACKGGGE